MPQSLALGGMEGIGDGGRDHWRADLSDTHGWCVYFGDVDLDFGNLIGPRDLVVVEVLLNDFANFNVDLLSQRHRDAVDDAAFEDILKRLQPSQRLLDLAIAMFKDAWNGRMELAQAERDEWRRQAEAADTSLLELIDRMAETKNAAVIKAIESKIEKLEREKMLLVEKASEPLPNAGKFEESIELSLRFLSRPWDIYKNGSYAVRQTVLRLAFSDPLTYTPEGVYGTPKTTLPFKVLAGYFSLKKV